MELVFSILGIDISCGINSHRWKDSSKLLDYIEKTEEFKTLKASFMAEVRTLVKDTPVTLTQKRALAAELRESIIRRVQRQCTEEIAEEYARLALAELRNDPNVSPLLVARQFVEASKK